MFKAFTSFVFFFSVTGPNWFSCRPRLEHKHQVFWSTQNDVTYLCANVMKAAWVEVFQKEDITKLGKLCEDRNRIFSPSNSFFVVVLIASQSGRNIITFCSRAPAEPLICGQQCQFFSHYSQNPHLRHTLNIISMQRFSLSIFASHPWKT